jgi:hypothetical protein
VIREGVNPSPTDVDTGQVRREGVNPSPTVGGSVLVTERKDPSPLEGGLGFVGEGFTPSRSYQDEKVLAL